MLVNPNGCDLSHLRHKCRQAMWLVISMMEVEGEDFTITHTNDGVHMAGSLHHKSRAFDFLPPSINKDRLEKQLKACMGPDYDLVVHEDHWHIEYDPK